jgi:hypothetical protein
MFANGWKNAGGSLPEFVFMTGEQGFSKSGLWPAAVVADVEGCEG